MKNLILKICFFWLLLILPLGFSGMIISNGQAYFSVKESSSTTHSLPNELIFCGIFPLSDTRGMERRDAFLMAIDEINAQSGTDRILPSDVSIKPMVADDQDNSAGGHVAANQCIESNSSIVIGSSRSPSSIAIAEELTPHKIIQISYASTHPELSDRTTYPYFMRVVKSEINVAKVMNDLVEAFQWNNGSVLSSTGFLSELYANEFYQRFPGTIHYLEFFNPNEEDGFEQLQSIATGQNEFIVLVANSEDAGAVFDNAYDLGLTANAGIAWIFVTNEIPPIIFHGNEQSKEFMQNVIQITSGELEGPLYGDFLDKWKETSTCGLNLEEGPLSPCAYARASTPNIYSAPAYDSVFVAAKGYAAASNANPNFTGENSDELLNHLYHVNHTGAGDSYRFDEKGEVEGPYNLYSLEEEVYNLIAIWNGDFIFKTSAIILPGDVSYNVINQKLVCNTNCQGTNSDVTAVSSSTTIETIPPSQGYLTLFLGILTIFFATKIKKKIN